MPATTQKLPNGVTVHKWPHKLEPNADNVADEMKRFGFKSYDLQTVPPWFERSRHSHDEEEIRGAVDGVITFHFDDGPVTIEAGDILVIPAGVAHEVITHNPRPFSAYKGSRSGVRSVTEHGDGRGSVEDLAQRQGTGGSAS
ncbi:MAG: cupin domain-containing protein [Myxococcota bacterium]